MVSYDDAYTQTFYAHTHFRFFFSSNFYAYKTLKKEKRKVFDSVLHLFFFLIIILREFSGKMCMHAIIRKKYTAIYSYLCSCRGGSRLYI